jgi:hypothetical protein
VEEQPRNRLSFSIGRSWNCWNNGQVWWYSAQVIWDSYPHCLEARSKEFPRSRPVADKSGRLLSYAVSPVRRYAKQGWGENLDRNGGGCVSKGLILVTHVTLYIHVRQWFTHLVHTNYRTTSYALSSEAISIYAQTDSLRRCSTQ